MRVGRVCDFALSIAQRSVRYWDTGSWGGKHHEEPVNSSEYASWWEPNTLSQACGDHVWCMWQTGCRGWVKRSCSREKAVASSFKTWGEVMLWSNEFCPGGFLRSRSAISSGKARGSLRGLAVPVSSLVALYLA